MAADSLFDCLINLNNQKFKFNIDELSTTKNRVNSMGDKFEECVCRAIVDGMSIKKQEDYMRQRESIISYVGNDSSPPDLIIKKGPAIEIKHCKYRAKVQLNS